MDPIRHQKVEGDRGKREREHRFDERRRARRKGRGERRARRRIPRSNETFVSFQSRNVQSHDGGLVGGEEGKFIHLLARLANVEKSESSNSGKMEKERRTEERKEKEGMRESGVLATANGCVVGAMNVIRY